MMASATHLGPSGDLSNWMSVCACVLALASFAMLLFEMRRGERGRLSIAATGLLAVAAVLAAVLRPARVSARETSIGARVVVLADASRSMALIGDAGRTRSATRDAWISRIRTSGKNARFVVLGFGEGPPEPLKDGTADGTRGDTHASRSDLGEALRALAASPEEKPAAVVVISDGRLDDPLQGASQTNLRALGDLLHLPIHTVATTRDAPPDASIRRVSAAGAAVAHVPLPIRVELGCAGGLACKEVA
ncbi:MAG: hypothetical protein M3O46_07215, partial [Myxococcota bacterium]|nr:hypothetical protein [Myxococcota bacterium]